MKIIVSDSYDVNENLALEQQLLTEEGELEFVLLYVNDECVVVGRNQIIEAEVDVDLCFDFNIPIVRRMSGGGTVWHDRGNVNYAFILNRENKSPLDYDFTKPIVAALASMGINATKDARNALHVNGYKISGTAAMFTRTRVLFHGTLLFQSNLELLEHVCKGRDDIVTKVRSVHDTVGNISDMLPEKMSVEQFIRRLKTFLETY